MTRRCASWHTGFRRVAQPKSTVIRGSLGRLEGDKKKKLMYQIVLACKGIPASAGAAGAQDIAEEFTHRPWHQNVSCEWDGSQLVLKADNDDSDGRAVRYAFSDAISACIEEGIRGSIEIVSISALPSEAPKNN
jgi:hypothetical protein